MDATAPSTDTLHLPVAFANRLDAAGLSARALDVAGNSYALVEISSDSGSFLVQWADLRSVEVRHVLGRTLDDSVATGFFHPTVPSPRVALIDPFDAVRRSEKAVAVMNGAFFETPGRPSSLLAFPIIQRGTVVSGGSSPYGPGRPGAAGQRWEQPLRALGLDSLVYTSKYDLTTGAPLGEPGYTEAIVSYAPSAHPSRIATRFHVLGALDGDNDETTETLVVVTSDGRTRIDAAAAVLTRLGAAPETFVTLDGGASVFLWNHRTGPLHQPAPAGGRAPQALPHYLSFSLRTLPKPASDSSPR